MNAKTVSQGELIEPRLTRRGREMLAPGVRVVAAWIDCCGAPWKRAKRASMGAASLWEAPGSQGAALRRPGRGWIEAA